MRSRQVKLEVLARELRLRELEELLRRPLVGEDRLEHQVRQQPILRARALLLSPFFFWAEAAAAHRRSGTPLRQPNGGCLGYAAAVWSAGARLPNLLSGSDRALQPVCTCLDPPSRRRPLNLHLPADKLARMPRGTIRGILALSAGGKVLVNCEMGMSRSSTCVLAYLMLRHHMSAGEALSKVGKIIYLWENICKI